MSLKQSQRILKGKSLARLKVVQALYSYQINPVSFNELYNLVNHKAMSKSYFKRLLQGVLEQRTCLEKKIENISKRSFREIDPVEAAILLMAIYELEFIPESPYKVVITQALMISERLANANSTQMINRVLQDCYFELT